jgi:hypothetical protein
VAAVRMGKSRYRAFVPSEGISPSLGAVLQRGKMLTVAPGA